MMLQALPSHSNSEGSITFEEGKEFITDTSSQKSWLAFAPNLEWTLLGTRSNFSFRNLVLKQQCLSCRMHVYALVFQSKLEQLWHVIVHHDVSILN